MILMWLGSFVIILFGLLESQKQISKLFVNLQKNFYEKGFESSFIKMLTSALDVVLLEASPQKSLYSAMALYNLRVLNLRSSVLIMSLSTLGAWWMLILGLLFLNLNGFFILGICAIAYVGVWKAPRAEIVLKWIFGTGLFLLGGEMLLQRSSVLQTLLGQSELAFALADGRFGAVLTILGVSVLLSLVIQVEFWSVVLALGLLVTSMISFNGALALVAGERMGRMLLFWWRSRSLNQDCRRVGWQFSLASCVGVLIGFFVAGEARSVFDLGFSVDLSSFQDKTLQFMFLFAVILFFQCVAQMAWGHFGCQVKVDELQDPHYINPAWKDYGLLSEAAMLWGQTKVHKRLGEIRYHLQGLGTLQSGQVPGPIQERLRAEEEQLSVLDQSLKG